MQMDETLAVFGVVKDPTALALATTLGVPKRPELQIYMYRARGVGDVKKPREGA